MPRQKQHFEKYLNNFLKIGLSICSDEIVISNKTYEKQIKIPHIENNTLVKLNTVQTIDYRKLVHHLKKKYKKMSKINPLVIILQNILQEMTNTIEKNLDSKFDVERDVLKNEELFNFILYYVQEFGLEYKHSNFKKIFAKFEKYIEREFYVYYYLVPIYNLYGDFLKIKLSDDLWIREIFQNEYTKIVNIQNCVMNDIPNHQRKLKYVVVCRLVRNKGSNLSRDALKKFENVINALRLFKSGNSQFGSLYLSKSEIWHVNDLQKIKQNYERPSSLFKIILNKNEDKKFIVFYKHLTNRIHLLNKSNFLESSIRRFGMAFYHKKPVDKIVDYVICLESLLLEGPGESTLKLSHRLAALLGRSDKERLEIWYFIKTAYNFRSGYLHKTEERNFIIDSVNIGLDIAAKKLEEYSKEAICRIITLLSEFFNQKSIIKELDESIYDRNRLKNILKILNR